MGSAGALDHGPSLATFPREGRAAWECAGAAQRARRLERWRLAGRGATRWRAVRTHSPSWRTRKRSPRGFSEGCRSSKVYRFEMNRTARGGGDVREASMGGGCAGTPRAHQSAVRRRPAPRAPSGCGRCLRRPRAAPARHRGSLPRCAAQDAPPRFTGMVTARTAALDMASFEARLNFLPGASAPLNLVPHVSGQHRRGLHPRPRAGSHGVQGLPPHADGCVPAAGRGRLSTQWLVAVRAVLAAPGQSHERGCTRPRPGHSSAGPARSRAGACSGHAPRRGQRRAACGDPSASELFRGWASCWRRPGLRRRRR